MVKYTIATLQAMIGAKPTGPINNIHEHPSLSTIWNLQRQISNGLSKVVNVKSPLDGHTGYIWSKEVFALFLNKGWKDPGEVGKCYEVPATTEEVVDPAFHSGSIGIAIKGFGTTPPVDILANLQQIYGKTIYQELDAALIRLNDPMNIMQPVEVMLRGIKEVCLLNTMKCNKIR